MECELKELETPNLFVNETFITLFHHLHRLVLSFLGT